MTTPNTPTSINEKDYYTLAQHCESLKKELAEAYKRITRYDNAVDNAKCIHLGRYINNGHCYLCEVTNLRIQARHLKWNNQNLWNKAIEECAKIADRMAMDDRAKSYPEGTSNRYSSELCALWSHTIATEIRKLIKHERVVE